MSAKGRSSCTLLNNLVPAAISVFVDAVFYGLFYRTNVGVTNAGRSSSWVAGLGFMDKGSGINLAGSSYIEIGWL